ncbi:MAG: hypothetical protein U5L01_16775 [Rheinheimera sp.]|nr:hypothetical protein [Rheinheimera sp.]
MAVNVGHFDDPTRSRRFSPFPREHLVFLGSKNFQDPGEYQQFMAAKGGKP